MSEKNKNKDNVGRLLDIMAKLRDPDGGCPWDVVQTHATIAPHTIEEAYEVADAIDQNDMNGLKDELGDLLFQVVFQAQIAKEAGDFDFDDVIEAISNKMVRRHPHVFADATIEDADAQTAAWEDHKANERVSNGDESAPISAIDGVTSALPALIRAHKLQKRAARVGFDWDTVIPVIGKVREELAEVEAEINGGDEARLRDEIGDLLFCCVNLARKLGIEPETALKAGNSKFERRFRRMEVLLHADGHMFDDLPVEKVLEVYWVQAKREE